MTASSRSIAQIHWSRMAAGTHPPTVPMRVPSNERGGPNIGRHAGAIRPTPAGTPKPASQAAAHLRHPRDRPCPVAAPRISDLPRAAPRETAGGDGSRFATGRGEGACSVGAVAGPLHTPAGNITQGLLLIGAGVLELAVGGGLSPGARATG